MSNKIALVTGGGSGIGRGIALALAREQIKVAVVGRRQEKLEEVVLACANFGGAAVGISADLCVEEDRRSVCQRVVDRLGRIDILVHGAGVLARGPLEQVQGRFASAVATNLTSAMELTSQARSELVRRQGSVAFVASTAGRVPFPYVSVYSGTKHGLVGFAESVRYELESQNVHVMVAYPPMTNTDMVRPMRLAMNYASEKLADPERVGAALTRQLLRRRPVYWGNWKDRLMDSCQRHAPGLTRRLLRCGRKQFRVMMTKEPTDISGD